MQYNIYQKQSENMANRSENMANSFLSHDNVPSHMAKPVKDILKSLGWDILFESMPHALVDQNFSNFEEVGKWLTNSLPQKQAIFLVLYS